MLVMIVSYETLRVLTAYLTNCKIGLLLCDEGHRLKNSGEHRCGQFFVHVLTLLVDSQTFQALKGLDMK